MLLPQITRPSRRTRLTSVGLDESPGFGPRPLAERNFCCAGANDPGPPDPLALDGCELVEEVRAKDGAGEAQRAHGGRDDEGKRVERGEAAPRAELSARRLEPGRGDGGGDVEDGLLLCDCLFGCGWTCGGRGSLGVGWLWR